MVFVVFAVVSLVAIIAKWIFDWDYRLKSEYATAAVISDVEQFVTSHNGQWPRAWEDLPRSDHARNYVKLDFNVSIEDLIADRDLIYIAIIPMSGEYHTYPHARRQLEQLRDTLARFHEERAE
jgi:hypothetical protein